MSGERRWWYPNSRSTPTHRAGGAPDSSQRPVRRRPSRRTLASARRLLHTACRPGAACSARRWRSISRIGAPRRFSSRAREAEGPVRSNLINPLGPRIVLASRSPRRSELLTLVGAHFTVHPVDVDEQAQQEERAEAHVLRLSEAKARAAVAEEGATPAPGEAVYVGADTIVTIDRVILGKPASAADAE